MSTKPPKGTTDRRTGDVYLKSYIIDRLKTVFDKYRFEPTEQPILEKFSTVEGVYGDEFNKSVYTIQPRSDDDQRERLLLRYDLTLPFARFCANKGLVKGRSYRYGSVFRRDDVKITRGRLREFYQIDCDIVGSDNGTLIYESEMINLVVDCLNQILPPNSFTVNINSRQLLFYVLEEVFGIDPKSIIPICSTLDKLDKFKDCSGEAIRRELMDKAIGDDHIEMIMKFVKVILSLPNTMNCLDRLELLLETGYINRDIYSDLKRLFDYFELTGIQNYVKFDPVLSRGLDYYTGLVYEVKYNNPTVLDTTITAGGRYDNIIGKLGNKKCIPAIGVSFGVERLIKILESLDVPQPKIPAQVFIGSVGKGMLNERVKLVQELRRGGVSTEMFYSNNPKMGGQLNYVMSKGIPYMIVIGETEISRGTVMFKTIATKSQEEITRHDILRRLMDQ